MYEQFYGLNEAPFSLTPDTGFVYRYAGHQEAVNDLLSGLHAGEGFMAVIAEVGSGKTLLCRKLLSLIPDNWASAYLPNPLLTPIELYRGIASELGIEVGEEGGLQRLQQMIFGGLVAVHKAGGRTVVLIDEAQIMGQSSLEALRLLSNLETEKEKLLHIVFFAQPEFEKRLSQHALRQLRQRITFVCQLKSILRSELNGYLCHRLSTAGYNGPSPFTDAAVRKIYRGSCGSPRLVNILAHKALLAAYGKGGRRVSARQVDAAVADSSPVDSGGTLSLGHSRLWLGLLSSLVLSLFVVLFLRGAV
jgi:MSHA biogenesis protein MshM